MTPNETRKKIAVAFHTARIKKDLSVTAIAKGLGINRTTYQSYEAARAEPSLSLGLKICRLLDIDTGEF